MRISGPITKQLDYKTEDEEKIMLRSDCDA